MIYDDDLRVMTSSFSSNFLLSLSHPSTCSCSSQISIISGNDLARCLRWGGGYEGESIPKLLEKISRAEVVMMDRWNVSIEALDEKEEITIPSHKVLKVSLSMTIQLYTCDINLCSCKNKFDKYISGYTIRKCTKSS